MLEIEAAPTPVRLEEKDGAVFAVPDDGTLPPLTSEQVRTTLEQVRR